VVLEAHEELGEAMRGLDCSSNGREGTCCRRRGWYKFGLAQRDCGVNEVKIGILAVQGDFEAHAAMLARLGADTAEVRTPDQLEKVVTG